jgi:glycosyltransferase involved in cell wall biosynthesis
MNKITALIITLNEEQRIGACIDSLSGVVDEVLVIDSMSRDQTEAIATAKGARAIELAFAGFGPQRNIGATYATHDMILVLDADERLSDELKASITSEKNKTTMAAAYECNRLNHIGDRAIRSAGWYPNRHIRLYDRREAKWSDREVHEEIMTDGQIVLLNGDLLHYSYDSIDQLKEKSTRYATLGAAVYKGKNILAILTGMIFSPVIKFIKAYILQLGFRDGYVGLMISYYRARETFLKYYWALV